MSSTTAFDQPTFDTETVSALFRVLSHPVRRSVITHLDGEETANIATLADELGDEYDSPQSHMMAILHHNHLPRLADNDLIDYEGGDIEANPAGVEWAADVVAIAEATKFPDD